MHRFPFGERCNDINWTCLYETEIRGNDLLKFAMKNRTNVLLLLILIGCGSYDEKIDNLIQSKDVNHNIRAYYLIGEKRDTAYIPLLIKDLGDPRISHHYRHKGMSIYQLTIVALKEISGLNPPNELTYRPDSLNIKFYQEWAMGNGYKVK